MKVLDELITSRVRVSVLRYFYVEREATGARKIAFIVQEDAGNVSYQLNSLVKSGLLKREDSKYSVARPKVFKLLEEVDNCA